MNCPRCQNKDTRVLASREHMEGKQIKRRRICMQCEYRFSSFEMAEERVIRVIKKNGSLQDYSPSKLREGVVRSLIKRPVSDEQIDHILDNVNAKLLDGGDNKVDSNTIGDWVLEELKQLDAVAFIRFASVYRSFNSVDEFIDAIEKIN